MNTIAEIEEGMASVILHPMFSKTQQEYHRLLAIMGNIEGDETISLAILACWNVSDILERS